MTESAGMTLKDEVLAVLPEAYPEETQHLLEVLRPGGVEVAREPAPGLVMMDPRDCLGTPFQLGEVLVTTAGVRRDGCAGHGSILGDEPAKALLLACLDLLEERELSLASGLRRTWRGSRAASSCVAGWLPA